MIWQIARLIQDAEQKMSEFEILALITFVAAAVTGRWVMAFHLSRSPSLCFFSLIRCSTPHWSALPSCSTVTFLPSIGEIFQESGDEYRR